MGRIGYASCLALSFLLTTIWTDVSAHAAATELVSVDSAGAQGNAGSTFSAVSADGRFVAFASRASNLVAGDTNGVDDVFVRDRLLGVTERASVDGSGAQANGMSVSPAISGDGRYVAFVSSANNLVAGDTNGRLDVFVHDRTTGATSRVSVDSGGAEATADSISPWLSHDGSRVVFASSADNLVPGDTNLTFDVFLHDVPTGVTTRVSIDSAGTQANGASLAPRISADGLVIVFHSGASNLVAADVNFSNDVFVHDLPTAVTSRVSVDSSGTPGNFQSSAGSLSADGRFVAFDSDATNLVAGDTNFRTDVFVHDRVTGVTSRVSVASDGTGANSQSGFVDPPAMSADGRFVAFASGATNLVVGDANNFVDMFRHDRLTGETTRVSVAGDESEGNAPAAHWPNLSADGSVVIFASQASNLVPGDGNGAQDVFAFSGGSCGDGVVEGGEQCDDGNLEDGDCCTASCTFAPVGSACEDGDECTAGDFCSAGACVSGPMDAESCVDPMRCYTAFPGFGKRPLRPGSTHLADPFQEGDAIVRGARSLCSAADLEGETAMPSEGPRLSCHYLRHRRGGLRSLQGQEVVVSNRFGVQTLALYRPDRLCLAAGLSEVPEDGSRDHYTCYEAEAVVDDPSARQGRFRQTDAYGRFDSTLGGTVDLCTVTSVNGSTKAHEAAHLVCYRGFDRRHRTLFDLFRRRSETVHHVLGKERLDLLRLKDVCVPSEILEDGPPPPIG